MFKMSLVWVVSFSLLVACQPAAPTFTATERQQLLTLSPLPALPANPTNRYADWPAAQALGKQLFFDARLSANGRISCATCHNPQKGWSDGRALSQGLAPLGRHAPTLWNVSYQRWQFWDGRADSLWAQALQPIEHPQEMGGSRHQIYRLFQQNNNYKQQYQKVFGTFPPVLHINRFYANIGKAIEAFERTIISRTTPFDHFAKTLRSHTIQPDSALSIQAQQGAKLFVGKARCILCHNGPRFSDGEFHNLGLSSKDLGRWQGIPRLKQDPFNGLGHFSDSPQSSLNDKVRYVIQRPLNRGEFKTPTLRQVATTAPYMHDGRFKTLTEVVQFYNRLDVSPVVGQREDTLQPLHLTPGEEQDLVAFLKGLSVP